MKLAKVECTCMQMLLIIFMFYYEKIGNQFLLLLLGRQTMWQTHLRDGVPLYPQRFNHGLSTHWDFSFSSFWLLYPSMIFFLLSLNTKKKNKN